MKPWGLLALALVAPSTLAQQPADDYAQRLAQEAARRVDAKEAEQARNELADCVEQFGRKFARTSAAPQDVADAALEKCRPERIRASDAFGRMTHLAPPSIDLLNDEMRRRCILAILEARFPAIR